jgi:hypothetical protein
VPNSVSIVFDNSAPGAVVPVVSNNGDGISISLDWQGYDEVANGNDIASYSIFISTVTYSDGGPRQHG